MTNIGLRHCYKLRDSHIWYDTGQRYIATHLGTYKFYGVDRPNEKTLIDNNWCTIGPVTLTRWENDQEV